MLTVDTLDWIICSFQKNQNVSNNLYPESTNNILSEKTCVLQNSGATTLCWFVFINSDFSFPLF